MGVEPSAAADSDWRQRFRVPTTLTQLARRNRSRGLAISNRTGTFQLYSWNVDSGQLAALTDDPKGRAAGVLSPDGDSVYYLHDAGGNELGHWVRLPATGGPPVDLTPDMPPYASWELSVSADATRVALVAADQAGFHLYVVDAAAPGAASAIFDTPTLTGAMRLSPAGSAVVIGSSARSGKPQFSLLAFNAASGAELAELWDGPGTSVEARMFGPRPDDTRLLAVSNRSGVNRPLIWDLADNTRHDLSLGELAGEIDALDWSPDGAQLLLCQVSGAVQRLYLYDLERGQARRLDHPAGVFSGAAFADAATIIVNLASSGMPPQVLALDAASGAVARVLIGPGEAPPSRALRAVHFAAADGAAVQAWLGLPAGPGPFPTILETHGGPAAAQMDGYHPGAQMWLDHGFAFLSVNYRGSTTFGTAFEEQIYGDLGRWELEDMAAARAWLIAEGLARPDAILLTGWSYGGYLTLLGLGRQPELWAGGMAGIAIADWTVQYQETAPTLRGYQVALLGGTPEEVPERYARSSPITYCDQVRAPVLVMQGRNDTRCPARPMEQYVAALQARGAPIEITWFDAGHGSYETEQQIAHAERMLRFAQGVLRGLPAGEA